MGELALLLVADDLADAKDLADVISKAVTALAVLAGGVWAYFKFVKGRTFRPRISVEVQGQWRSVAKRELFCARIIVKNIGSSKVTLLQYGTGLRVSIPAEGTSPHPSRLEWKELSTFSFLVEHEWIEPSETVSDDLVLDLGLSQPSAVLCEARTVWKRVRKNVVVFARKIMFPVPVGNSSEEIESRNESRDHNGQ